jgi:hypothetical protein
MTGSMTGSMTDSAARASLGQVLDACRQLARETLAFLEIRQDAAQKKPHQEDVGSNDPRKQWVDRDNLPPEEMHEKFRAYYQTNCDAYSQQKTVSVIDGHLCLSWSDCAEPRLLTSRSFSSFVAQRVDWVQWNE